VTHHLVDRSEDGLGIPVIPHVGRDGALDIHDMVVADAVERLRAHPRYHMRLNHAENLCGKPTGPPHHLEFRRRLDGNAVRHQCFSAGDAPGLPSCPEAAKLISIPPASSALINNWQISR
jgi:hypothetical protein